VDQSEWNVNVLESQWLGERLAGFPVEVISPIVNVGSSTEDFRTREQPHIDANIFAPSRRRGVIVYHVDRKRSAGVDLVGDVLDNAFLTQVGSIGVRAAIVSNLLEHVEHPSDLGNALVEMLPAGGLIFVSGPKDYPFHADPIDNMFRPDIDEVHRMFPGTSLVDSAIIDSGNWRSWNAAERGRSLKRTVVRTLMPFYRPSRWWETARQAPYIVKPITAFAAVLRKE